MRLETHTRSRLTHELDPRAFKGAADFFDSFEMCLDRPFKSLKSPDGRDRYAGISGELMLFPADERSCGLYLSRDDQHGFSTCLSSLGNLSIYLLLRAQLLPLHRSSICHNELVASG